MTSHPPKEKARFVLTVEAKDGQAGIHALRWLLKLLGHRGLRCIDAHPLPISDEVDDDFSAPAMKGEIDVVLR